MHAEAESLLAARQNQAALLHLLRAASTSHRRAQRLESIRLVVSILVAALGLIAAFSSVPAMPIATLGGLWGLAYASGLAAWNANELRRAALLQEMFDVELLQLPWNEVAAGPPVGAQDVSRLSRQCRNSDVDLQNYYVIAKVPRPYDVLGCQMQNLGWAARVRGRYSRVLLMTVVTWSALGPVVGWLGRLTVPDLLLRWYIPSIGLALLALDAYRAERDAVRERERVLSLIEGRVRTAAHQPVSEVTEPLLTLARQVQDVIFRARSRYTRVPELFFRRYRARDRMDFEAAMINLEHLVTMKPDPAQ